MIQVLPAHVELEPSASFLKRTSANSSTIKRGRATKRDHATVPSSPGLSDSAASVGLINRFHTKHFSPLFGGTHGGEVTVLAGSPRERAGIGRVGERGVGVGGVVERALAVQGVGGRCLPHARPGRLRGRASLQRESSLLTTYRSESTLSSR